jgi:sortase (surface protein transpeptidase)
MLDGPSWFEKVRCSAILTGMYLLTITFAVYAVQPLLTPLEHTHTVAITKAAQQPHLPSAAKVKVIAGRPVRIVIPADGVDLPVDEGFYDSTDDSWTLSGYHAQFAMISTLANNVSGETFIYGHNNDYVFGALRHATPPVGTTALLYTDNGHIFAYDFQSVRSVGPTGTTVLDYSGAPILLIQTCTGSLNEWRTEFTFSFDRVVQ